VAGCGLLAASHGQLVERIDAMSEDPRVESWQCCLIDAQGAIIPGAGSLFRSSRGEGSPREKRARLPTGCDTSKWPDQEQAPPAARTHSSGAA